MANDILQFQKDAFGFILSLPTGVDMTTTTSLQIKLKKPSGVVLTKNLDNTDISNASVGLILYTVEDGDLDEAGTYKLQIIDNTAGRFLPSVPSKFKVKPNIF